MAGKKPTKLKRTIKAEKKYVTLEGVAAHCGVTREAVRQTIARYPDFPIHAKNIGGAKRGYEIDLTAVDIWREKHQLLNWKPVVFAGDPRPDDSPIPRIVITTKDRKNKIQTDLLQLELDKEMGLLIDRAEVVKTLSTAFAQAAKNLDQLPSFIGRKFNLAPEMVEAIRDHLDAARRVFARSDKFWEIKTVEDLENAVANPS